MNSKVANSKRSIKLQIQRINKYKQLYIMILPFLLYYALFYFKPIGGLKMAFMDYKPFLGMEGSEWVGLENFIKFFTSPNFTRVFTNTLAISILNMLFGFPVPIILALLFYELRSKVFRSVAQTISYLPRFISSVVVAGMVVNFLSPSTGVINFMLRFIGMEPIYFLTRPEYFRAIYILQGIWGGAGFGSIIYYSSLCSVDTELFEAVKIDGGGRFRQIWHIALPGIRPTIAVMLILSMGGLLNVGFEMIILLYQPVTYSTADVIGSYVYRFGIGNSNYSMSTAVGLFNGVTSLILVALSNKISKKIGSVSIF